MLAVLLLISFLLPLCANAQTSETEGIYCGNENITWSYDTEQKKLTFKGSGALDMGSSLDMLNLKGCYAFQKEAQSIVIEKGIMAIGDAALATFINVKSVKLPTGVTKIGNYAFAGCKNLTKINLPTGLKTIGEAAITSDIAAVKLPSTLTSIGAMAICSSKFTSLTLPKSLKTIADGAFGEMTNLKKITVQSGNAYFTVKSGSLYNKKATRLVWVSPLKKGAFAIPEKVTKIDGAFDSCDKITSLTIPSTLPRSQVLNLSVMEGLKAVKVSSKHKKLSAKDGVLYDKKKTELVLYPSARTGAYVMPDTVKTTEYEVFDYATAITSMTIGGSLKTIEFNFPTCVKFKTIKVSSKNKYYSAKDGVLYNKKKTKLVAFPAGKTGKFTVPSSVTAIAEMAFLSSRLTEVVVKDGVKTIGEYAFAYSERLTTVRLSKNVKSLYGTFAGCKKLKKVTLPVALTAIESGMFSGCKALTSISIYKNVKSVDGYAFENSGIKTVRISSANPYLSYKDGMFFSKDKKTLKTVMFTKAKTLTIPEGTQTIAAGCLESCDNVEKIYLPASLKRVCKYSLGSSAASEFYFEGDCPKFDFMGYKLVDGEFKDTIDEFSVSWQADKIKIYHHEGAAGFDTYEFKGGSVATY